MEPRKVNPFIVGDWIKDDKDFIGRESLIRYFLSLQKQFSWLVGSRRMGKTSLLRFLQRRFRDDQQVLPVFWDVSGINTSHDVLERLQDALESSRADLDARHLGFNIDTAQVDVYALLRALARSCAEHQVLLVLLIDEAEALFNLFARERDALFKMKAVLDQERIHVVMASNHGLESIDPLSTEHLISPFLQGFAPAQFLQAWSREEAVLLIDRCTMSEPDRIQIMAATGGLPFLVQMVCFYYYELNSVAASLQIIKDRHLLDLFFRHDLHCLGAMNSRMLSYLGHQQPVHIEVLQNIHSAEPSWLLRLTLLQQLGFITKDAESFVRISNEFLSDWLLMAFPSTAGTVRGKPAKILHRLWLCLNRDAIRVDWNEQTIYVGPLARSESKPLETESIVKAGRGLFQEIFAIPELLPVKERLSSEHDYFQIYLEHIGGGCPPIEWLHDGRDFLGLRHAITRVKEGVRLPGDAQPPAPWRILLIAADTPPPIPRVDQEIVLIRELLKAAALEKNKEITVDCLFSYQSDLETVQRAVTSGRYNIVHYAGHAMAADGATDHQLLFKQHGADQQAVRAIWVSEWLRQAAMPIHLLYINGCGQARSRVPSRYPDHVRFYLYNRTQAMDEFSANFALDLYRLLLDSDFDPVGALPSARKLWYERHSNNPLVQEFWHLPVIYRLQ